jgi:hypothetical protein
MESFFELAVRSQGSWTSEPVTPVTCMAPTEMHGGHQADHLFFFVKIRPKEVQLIKLIQFYQDYWAIAFFGQ